MGLNLPADPDEVLTLDMSSLKEHQIKVERCELQDSEQTSLT